VLANVLKNSWIPPAIICKQRSSNRERCLEIDIFFVEFHVGGGSVHLVIHLVISFDIGAVSVDDLISGVVFHHFRKLMKLRTKIYYFGDALSCSCYCCVIAKVRSRTEKGVSVRKERGCRLLSLTRIH